MTALSITSPDGVPEVRRGDDLAGLLLSLVELADGDVVVVTSKVVSKAEGRTRPGNRDEALEGETVRVVARRGPTTIVRTRLGLTMAAAGIDESNVQVGHIVLLPEDPDASARAIRAAIRDRTGHNVGVIVTDTAGRTWREGQTDIAIGAAGLRVLEDFAGRTDQHGNELAVTAPAVADEIAGASELAQGKLSGRPFAVVRGRADLVLPVGDDGPGARALVRPDDGDLFGFGAREAVIRALRGDRGDRGPFGAPVPATELVSALQAAFGPGPAVATAPDRVSFTLGSTGPDAANAVAFAHGWEAEQRSGDTRGAAQVRFRPVTP